jgi:cytochrome c-type biogenesis protein CcmH
MTSRAAIPTLAAALAMALALAVAPAFASDAAPTEKDPVAQARAVKLSETLRCLVCQNQTIADSNAELAVDLRKQVREQIAAGKSDDEIITYMTDRYGDFVLYRPPVRATTVLLWGGPALLLAIGAFVLMRIMRERRAAPEAPPLTAEERARADALLASPTKKDPA